MKRSSFLKSLAAIVAAPAVIAKAAATPPVKEAAKQVGTSALTPAYNKYRYDNPVEIFRQVDLLMDEKGQVYFAANDKGRWNLMSVDGKSTTITLNSAETPRNMRRFASAAVERKPKR